jgi:superfamily II RNA helicase
MESFIKNQVSAICRILIDRGFIEIEEENYRLTALGKMAGSIAEVHGLIMSEFIIKNDYFADFNERDLVGILSCFTDIKIADDERKTVPPTQMLKDLMKLYKEYQELETTHDIRTGIHYDDALQFDMFEFSMKWTKCANEQECKEFIQNDVADKGISVGDFNKAMMKIATIAKELMKVAEDAGQIDLLYKLSKIEGLVFKYVTTAQSLYL